jgi:hypothetical protein
MQPVGRNELAGKSVRAFQRASEAEDACRRDGVRQSRQE